MPITNTPINLFTKLAQVLTHLEDTLERQVRFNCESDNYFSIEVEVLQSDPSFDFDVPFRNLIYEGKLLVFKSGDELETWISTYYSTNL